MNKDKRKIGHIKSSFAILVFLFLSFISPAHGNDAVYFGSGVTVYPVKHEDIQLVSEVITITKGVGLGWGVEAVLNFKNHGDKTSVQMGFPFDTYGPEEPWDTDNTAQFDPKYLPNPKFRTFIKGQEIKVIRRKGWDKSPLQDLNYPVVYTFTVPFEKGEAKSIRHTYSVMGTDWSTGDYEIKYILKTGALWKGNIENIKVKMILPRNSVSEITEITPQVQSTLKKKNTTVYLWEFKKIKPDFNIKANFRKPNPHEK